MTNLDHLKKEIEALSTESQAKLSEYVRYLRWVENEAQAENSASGWSFDLVEHFGQASKRPSNQEKGAEIKIDTASSGGELRPAIYAHPPVSGYSVVEYYIPVPDTVRAVQLVFGVGIRDGSKLAGSNLVAFSVRLNGYRVWGTQTKASHWEDHRLSLEMPPGDVHRLELLTQALDDHQWTWAVWGQPRLTGKVVK